MASYTLLYKENEQLHQEIKAKLPYAFPFAFVQNITILNQNKIVQEIVLSKELPFFNGHFVHQAVTPGVLLLEAIGQLVVAHGIYIKELYKKKDIIVEPLITNANCEWWLKTLPGQS